jgi:hypothetical protein
VGVPGESAHPARSLTPVTKRAVGFEIVPSEQMPQAFAVDRELVTAARDPV